LQEARIRGLLSSQENKNAAVDVVIRTRNSSELLSQCLDSIFAEIPVRKVIIVDGGSTDDTLKIASSYPGVEIYVKPELNLGQATQFGFSVAKADWVAVIDSDMVLQKGWFDEMSKYMDQADAIEGCRIEYYRLRRVQNLTKVRYGVFGQTLLKRSYLQDINLDLPHGEDAATKHYFDSKGLKWLKVENYLAEHYPKFETNVYRRTGTVIATVPRYVPKKQQIEEGHVYKKYKMVTTKEVIWQMLIRSTAREAYIAFRTKIWFVLAYLGLI
jgi:glycosyltransferase involved in cell wall biosynthesis